MRALQVAAEVAGSTGLELLRRPGLALASIGIAAFLLVMHGLSATALDPTGALATELALSTTAVFSSVVAAVFGVRSSASSGAVAATSEWRSAPVTGSTYLAGRLFGVTVGATLLAVPLILAAAAGHALSGRQLPGLAPLLFAMAGIPVQAGLLAGLGQLFGAALPTTLATTLVIFYLAASRLLLPAMLHSEGLGALATLAVPDPGRLDFARDAAFGRAMDSGSVLLAMTSAGLQIAGLLCLSSLALSRRED